MSEQNEIANPRIRNLSRIEFLITMACTGRCKHCSEGEHKSGGGHIDGRAAAAAVRSVCGAFDIQSLMTFGGEPLLYPDEVCGIHAAAAEMNIPKRQLITNGFFSQDEGQIRETAKRLAESGVNAILLSVDAFHQETIPIKPVKLFAQAAQSAGIPLRTSPAWLSGADADNPYNRRTREIVRKFEELGVAAAEGNVIFPSGNARKYLGEYFDPNETYMNPYEEDPDDIRSVCVDPDGNVLGGNICRTDILRILQEYGNPGELDS